uniref:Teneurin-4-like n=1 Tax=Petromyzon marinus TaxID=7757 RepID=A0AAJ7SKG2_PETMA
MELRSREVRHSASPAHKYYVAVCPVTGAVIVSDGATRRLYRVPPAPPPAAGGGGGWGTPEVLAGTGEQCLPMDPGRCGDGGAGTAASLTQPRGVAVDERGLVYFVDGSSVRRVDQNGAISTVLGSTGLAAASARPLSCGDSMDAAQVRLEWPTDLAVSPLDNSLLVLDTGVVLQVWDGRRARVVAGRPPHCTAPGGVEAPPASAPLESPVALAVSPDGALHVAETDGRRLHRVRRVAAPRQGAEPGDGGSGAVTVAGGVAPCDCGADSGAGGGGGGAGSSSSPCECFGGDGGSARDARLHSPTALAFCPDGSLYIADLGNVRVRVVREPGPMRESTSSTSSSTSSTSSSTSSTSSSSSTSSGRLLVPLPAEQELLVFSAAGRHLSTRSLVTGATLLSFSYGGGEGGDEGGGGGRAAVVRHLVDSPQQQPSPHVTPPRLSPPPPPTSDADGNVLRVERGGGSSPAVGAEGGGPPPPAVSGGEAVRLVAPGGLATELAVSPGDGALLGLVSQGRWLARLAYHPAGGTGGGT